jgi:hypothetical protein
MQHILNNSNNKQKNKLHIKRVKKMGKMKLDNRVRLRCTKQIRTGLNVLDTFSVVVLSGEEGNVKKNYESMGCTVTKVNL